MSELKPCPFCGGDNLSKTNQEPPEGYNIPYRYGVYCVDCHAGNRYYDTPQDAISAWNTRHERIGNVELEEAVAGIDELRGTLDNMNSNGVIGYGDYSQLFDLLCGIHERIEAAQNGAKVVES